MDGFWPTFIRRKPTPLRLVAKMSGKPTRDFLHPKTVIVPLQDTPETPYQCSVKAREDVAAGQKIGEKGVAPNAVSVHASISGKVREIDSFFSPNGCYVTGVLIEADGREEPCQKISAPTGAEAKIETLQEAGIPLDYERLSRGQVETLFVNGTEFEPTLDIHHPILEEKTSEVLGGLQALMRIFSVSQAVICVEGKERKLIHGLEKAAKDSPGITLVPTRKSYPATAGDALVAAILKKGDRAASGQKVFQVELSFLPAVYEAVLGGLPFIERVITVAGSGVPSAQNLQVKVGTPFNEIIVHCGGNLEAVTQIVMGGPLMGISQPSGEIPVTQATPGILALVSISLSHRQSRMYEEGPCVRCAKCVDVCPVFILPNTLAAYCRKRRFEEARETGLWVCIDCGLCSYVCPAGIPLAQILKEAKSREALRPQANPSSGNH